MKTDILLFGQLAEQVGAKQISLEGFSDSETLIKALQQQYPVLSQSKYIVAINQEIISGNTALSDNSIVALLPPFSGG
ncbi:MAG TPA: molybdopterin synthase sulfur carrier subunit [Chitinophagaceae bacterium]|nr:molybdopterin synthase sulfur carrier subunit [Chitinophagaceae bacterium]